MSFNFYVFRLVVLFSSTCVLTSNAQLKVNSVGDMYGGRSLMLGKEQSSGRLHIGDPYTYAGGSGGTGGRWALEYYEDGLNFWNVWTPSHVGRDYDIFIDYETGCVGIGKKPASGYRLDVAGQIAINGININSDLKLKKNVKEVDAEFTNLYNLKAHKYNYIEKYQYKTFNESEENTVQRVERIAEKENIGLIAQQVQEQFPELVSENSEGHLTIDYVGLVSYMLEALKDQNEQIQSLKNLKNKSASLDVDSYNESYQDSNGSVLNQNTPNPFSTSTLITYKIAENVLNAKLLIFDMNGGLKKTYALSPYTNRITIAAGSFKPGMYIYSLVCDGKEVDTKRMILTE